MLAGFNTFKREGIELTGSFAATVNADLRVGALAEAVRIPLAKAGCGPRKSGSVVLFAHMDMPVSIERIVIEGQLLPASLRELQAHWMAEQLAALGFP